MVLPPPPKKFLVAKLLLLVILVLQRNRRHSGRVELLLVVLLIQSPRITLMLQEKKDVLCRHRQQGLPRLHCNAALSKEDDLMHSCI